MQALTKQKTEPNKNRIHINYSKGRLKDVGHVPHGVTEL
jgi:hypothetical protein